jgi:hypothetical protein
LANSSIDAIRRGTVNPFPDRDQHRADENERDGREEREAEAAVHFAIIGDRGSTQRVRKACR